MRVALVTYGMIGGGIETFLLNLGEYLRDRGCDVTIVTTEFPGAWFDRIRRRGLNGLHIDGLGRHSPLEHLRKIAAILYSGDFDALLLNHARFAQAALGLAREIPVVIPVLHCNVEFFAGLSVYRSELCRSIVTVSPAGAKIINKLSPECPVRVILNGVAPVKNEGKTARDFNQVELRLIYVGRIYNRDKGVFLLPPILKRLRERGISAGLDIVGDGKDLAELQYRFRQAGLENFVKYWGFLTEEQVYDLLGKDHILLFTTPAANSEGLPLVTVEAQICGCVPVAALLKDSTDWVITDGATGFLVTPEAIDQFCEAVRKLDADRGLLRRMSATAAETARQKLSLPVMGEEYYRLLSESVVTPAAAGGDSLSEWKTLKDYLAFSPVAGVSTLYRKWLDENEKGRYITGPLSGKTVAIFGSLRTALYLAYDCANAGVKVEAFIDNNPEIHGQSLNGIPIWGKDWLSECQSRLDAVLISVESREDLQIKRTLEADLVGLPVYTWKELAREVE